MRGPINLKHFGKVAIIGAGRRVERTILPALKILGGNAENIHIIGRNIEKTRDFCKRKRVTFCTGLNNDNIKAFSLIIIAVSNASTADVIKNLARLPVTHIILFIDTPVLVAVRDLAQIKNFTKFKKVLTTEGWVALPIIRIASELIKSKYIGVPRKIYLFNAHFKYHAVAGLKKLIEEKYIVLARSLSYDKINYHYKFIFKNESHVK